MRRIRLASSVALALVHLGCDGPAFDPPSVVDSLRVLAVRGEPASGAPGETVTLEMLHADGAPRRPGEPARPIQIAWLGGCHNPPSRLYFDCFSAISGIARELSPAVVDTPPDALPPGSFGVGSTFSLPIPDDILSSAPRAAGDPVHFGVSYAFFAACAGELRPRPERRDRVPLACVDPNSGVELGSEDFVQGFTTLPTYEDARNENPTITSLRFGSLVVAGEQCSADADCDALGGTAPGELGCSESGRCAPIVRPCSGDDCPQFLVFPEIDRTSAEALPGEDAREIVWASFYATDGELGSAAQLVNDRATGWIDDHGTNFYAPETAGTVELYVTVNDERGGATWRSFEVLIRDGAP